MREATKLIMFTGNMNGLKCGKLVETGLVPFTRTTFQMDTGFNRTMILNIVTTISKCSSNFMTCFEENPTRIS